MTPGDWMTRTFAQALDWSARQYGQREAVVHGERRLTFSELAERARAFARGLMDLGVQPGDKVALWMADCPEWLVARWAVPMIGAVLVPVNTRFRDQDVRYVLEQSDSSFLIVQERAPVGAAYFSILGKVEPGWRSQPVEGWCSAVLPCLKRVVGLGVDLPGSMTGFGELEARGRRLLADGELARRSAAVQPDDVAQILYTSGTTSFPKGAMVCHGPLLRNNCYAADCMRLGPDDRYLACVPLFTATGTFYTLALWLSGAAMVIADRFEPRAFCELVQRERITASYFVDTIVQDLKAFAERDSYDLSSLRTGTGAPLPTASFHWVTETMGAGELVSAYGMSETTNAVLRSRWDDPLDKRATTHGRPVDGVRIKIVDVDSGAELGPGQVGEICVSGYVLMKGYYKQPEETGKVLTGDGWLRTGDLGERDADGYVSYRGRVKEMIKPGGFNVATQEIEVFLKTYPGVRQAVVVGVPDARLGEVPYAFIEPDDGVDIDAQALIAYCREHIAGYKVPRHIECIDQWPLTGSQKIRKLELKERARLAVEGAGAQEAAQP